MTSQVHAVARELPEYDAVFAPYFADGILGLAARRGLLDRTSLGRKQRAVCLDYARRHGLAVDPDAAQGPYDLVVTSSDVVVPHRLRSAPIVGVQEGMLDPELFWFHARRLLPFLPRWIAGTAYTGTNAACDRFCVASEGFRAQMIRRGAQPARLVVTGIPNFDDCGRFAARPFPEKDFVLVCTSDGRETLKWCDRRAFAKRVARIAAGRPILVKLHPNEDAARSTREFARFLPGARVLATGDTEAMIARCAALIVEWSSTALVGLALGKEVHSNFASESLRSLVPLVSDGKSAARIADVCREVVATKRNRLAVARDDRPKPFGQVVPHATHARRLAHGFVRGEPHRQAR